MNPVGREPDGGGGRGGAEGFTPLPRLETLPLGSRMEIHVWAVEATPGGVILRHAEPRGGWGGHLRRRSLVCVVLLAAAGVLSFFMHRRFGVGGLIAPWPPALAFGFLLFGLPLLRWWTFREEPALTVDAETVQLTAGAAFPRACTRFRIDALTTREDSVGGSYQQTTWTGHLTLRVLPENGSEQRFPLLIATTTWQTACVAELLAEATGWPLDRRGTAVPAATRIRRRLRKLRRRAVEGVIRVPPS